MVLAVTLFVVFALPHLTSLFYYNPNEIVNETDERYDTNYLKLPSDNVFMKTEDTFSCFAHDYMGEKLIWKEI